MYTRKNKSAFQSMGKPTRPGCVCYVVQQKKRDKNDTVYKPWLILNLSFIGYTTGWYLPHKSIKYFLMLSFIIAVTCERRDETGRAEQLNERSHMTFARHFLVWRQTSSFTSSFTRVCWTALLVWRDRAEQKRLSPVI